jgi:flagellar biosynthesis chaperone FliJ
MKERISGALSQINRGIEFAGKSVCDSRKDEMRYLRLAIEEIRNGLALIEDHLAELENERHDGRNSN